MSRTLALWVGVAIALASCNGPVEEVEGSVSTSDVAIPQPYGVDGTLTPDQADWLKGLTWPQTYDAMKSTFGLPAYRSDTVDVYQVEGSQERIEVHYSGDQAVGYESK